MKSKHIVIDAREFATSTGRPTAKLLEYLPQIDKKNKYTVLLLPKDMDGWKPPAKNFTKQVCPHKEFTFSEQIGYLKQLRKLNADLIYFPMVQQPVLYFGRVVTMMNDLTTVRFTNPSKNRIVFAIKQQVYKWVNKIVARKSRKLITFTEFVKDDVAKFAKVNSRKITVVNLAADAITDKPEPVDELEDKDFIMYIGRPLPHKNLPRLVDAFEQLRQKHPNLRLVLAGKKDKLYKEIAKDVKRRGLQNVVFTGFISEGQLRWLYEHTKAYVFPSLSEGFGLPGLEAMVHGAPVASSDATCLPEVYGDAAYYFNPHDTADMVDKIDEVLTNDDLRRKLVKAGKKQAAKYSWQKTASKMLDIFESVLD